MTDREARPIGLNSLLLPSDFTPASDAAFAHALKIALVGKLKLTIFHVSNPSETELPWEEYPRVRQTLVSWGLAPPEIARHEVAPRLGIRVRKVAVHGRDPFSAILSFLDKEPTDLIVLSTRGERVDRWLPEPIAGPLMRHARIMTLFVPADGKNFVDLDSGKVNLKTILVPVDHQPAAEPALLAAAEVSQRIAPGPVRLVLLHVGNAAASPEVSVPNGPRWSVERMTRQGSVVDQILEASRSVEADLVIMRTEGRHGFLDALRGSCSERVVSEVGCPLLAVFD